MCWRGTTARRGISLGDITVHLSIGQRRGNDSSHGITVFSLTLCPAPTFMSGLFFVNHHCLPAVWLLLCWVDKSLSVNYHNLAPPQSLHPDLSMVIRWHLVWACKAVGFIPLVIVREGEGKMFPPVNELQHNALSPDVQWCVNSLYSSFNLDFQMKMQ